MHGALFVSEGRSDESETVTSRSDESEDGLFLTWVAPAMGARAWSVPSNAMTPSRRAHVSRKRGQQATAY